MKISIIADRYSIIRLPPCTTIPSWIDESNFWAVTKTQDELSIVCRHDNVPDGLKVEAGWSIMKVHGPLSFELTGILVAIAKPLAEVKVGIFVISTFDTDYIFVKENQLEFAKHSLIQAGFEF